MKIFTILSIIFFTSCGAFIQNQGMKSYPVKDKSAFQNLNDYQYDFEYLSQVLEIGFPKLDSVYPKEKRQKDHDEILHKLGQSNLREIDFLMQMRKYLSNCKNQHTTVLFGFSPKKIYPFYLYPSHDNWYVYNIPKEDSLVIGKKVVNMNGQNMDQIEQKLIDFTFEENKINQQHQVMNARLYNLPPFLKEIGVIQSENDKLSLSFDDGTSKQFAPVEIENHPKLFINKIPKNPITKRQPTTYDFQMYDNYGYMQFNGCYDKDAILLGIESYVKPWLQPVVRAYMKRQFKKEKPSKRVAEYYNPKHPIFKDFVWEMVDSLNKNNIKNLVIDLRYNGGGDITIPIQLMYFLTDQPNKLKGFKSYAYTSDFYMHYFKDEDNLKDSEKNKLFLVSKSSDILNEIIDSSSIYYIPEDRPIFKGKVIVLANYGTGSAAAMCTTLLQDNRMAIIIGTNVGNNPTGATIIAPVKLPKSKGEVSIASTYNERPDTTKGKLLVPDYWIEYSVDDIYNGNDPFLNKALELMD